MIATARDVRKAPGLQALTQKYDRDRLQVVTLDVTDPGSLQVTSRPVLCTDDLARSYHQRARHVRYI